MEVRFLPDNNAYKRMTTDELRKAFLVSNLFNKNRIDLLYTDNDRAIIGSAVPSGKTLKLAASKKEMAADYFTERREIGIINMGGEGTIKAGKKEFKLKNRDGLYVGRGTKTVEFKSKSASKPARFYIVSYPAHTEYPCQLAKYSNAEPANLGSQKEANKRTIYKYIHMNGIKSCQLVMGLTELDEGSIWNTMSAHTHLRRSEIYAYFNLDKDSLVVHLMGEPEETRNIIVRDGQAVVSPSWSIHAGAGTKNYTFIWAMGGENQEFGDMDQLKVKELF